MLKPAPPLTNAERQAMFQASHPGYDRRRKARQHAKSRQRMLARRIALQAQAAQASAAVGTEPASDGSQLLLFPAMRVAA